MAKIVVFIIICILTFYMACDSKWVFQQIGLKPEVDKQRAAEKIASIQKFCISNIVKNTVQWLTAPVTLQEFVRYTSGISDNFQSSLSFALSSFKSLARKLSDCWSSENPKTHKTSKNSSKRSKKSKRANRAKRPRSFTVKTSNHLLLGTSSNQCRDNKCQNDADTEKTWIVSFRPLDELSANADNSMQIYTPKQLYDQKKIIDCYKLDLFNQLGVQDLLKIQHNDNIADGALAIWIKPESDAESSQTDENANEDVDKQTNKPTCMFLSTMEENAIAESTLGWM